MPLKLLPKALTRVDEVVVLLQLVAINKAILNKGKNLRIIERLQKLQHGFSFKTIETRLGIKANPPVVIVLEKEFIVDEISFSFIKGVISLFNLA